MQRQWQPCSARWLGINPGARWPNKRWPVEYFAQLVQLLSRNDPALRFAILGSKEDAAAGAIISQAEPQRCLNLAGQTSLPEMVEWIRLCELLVTNDTGPMHVAAALGKPVVAMFGPTDPRRTGPYLQTQQVLRISLPCAPCFKPTCSNDNPLECLQAITPAMVYQAVQRRLAESVAASSASPR